MKLLVICLALRRELLRFFRQDPDIVDEAIDQIHVAMWLPVVRPSALV